MSEAKEQILLQLAKEKKVIYYDVLMKRLNCKTITEVDDIIISAINHKLFEGHIDHKQRCLFVSSIKIDQVKAEDIPKMTETLEHLSAQCSQAFKIIN